MRKVIKKEHSYNCFSMLRRGLFWYVSLAGTACALLMGIPQDLDKSSGTSRLYAQAQTTYDTKLNLVYKKKVTPNDPALRGLDVQYTEGIPIIAKEAGRDVPSNLDVALANALGYLSRRVGIFGPPVTQTQKEFTDLVSRLETDLKRPNQRNLIVSALVALQQERVHKFDEATATDPIVSEGMYLARLVMRKRMERPDSSSYSVAQTLLADYGFALRGESEAELPKNALTTLEILKTHMRQREVPILYRKGEPYAVTGYITGQDGSFLIVHDPVSAEPRITTERDFLTGNSKLAESLRQGASKDPVKADWIGEIAEKFHPGIHVYPLGEFTRERGFIIGSAFLSSETVDSKLK